MCPWAPAAGGCRPTTTLCGNCHLRRDNTAWGRGPPGLPTLLGAAPAGAALSPCPASRCHLQCQLATRYMEGRAGRGEGMGKGHTVARPAHPGPTAQSRSLEGRSRARRGQVWGEKSSLGETALKHRQCETSVTQVRGTGHGGRFVKCHCP